METLETGSWWLFKNLSIWRLVRIEKSAVEIVRTWPGEDYRVCVVHRESLKKHFWRQVDEEDLELTILSIV